jgi:hypothetical protein
MCHKLAVARVEVDGDVLEGRGVEPHISVSDALAFAAGKDAQLDRALEVAALLASRPEPRADASCLPRSSGQGPARLRGKSAEVDAGRRAGRP